LPQGFGRDRRTGLKGTIMDEKKLLIGYWAAMGLAILAVFLPWASVSMSINMPGLMSESHSESAAGFHVLWGWLTLLTALAAAALSLIGPAKILREKTRWIMLGLGGAIVLWALINFIAVHSHQGPSASDMAGMGGAMKYSISAGLGTWLALLAGLAAAGTAYLLNWELVQPVIRNPAVDQMVAKGMAAVQNVGTHQTPHQRAEHRVQDAIRKLESAKASGVISEEEFTTKRAAELARMPQYEAEYAIEAKTRELQHALSTGVITQAEFDTKLAAAKAASATPAAVETPVAPL
jgi:hypothetical protein